MGDFGGLARGLAAAAVTVVLGWSAMAQDGIRMIEGSLTYRERVALPERAVAVIEARDGRGRLLGEATFATRGAQVPVPFGIAVPAGLEAELRAAFVVDGRPSWYAAGIGIPAGTEPVVLGEVMLARFVPMGFASTLRCGGRELALGFFEANSVIEVDGRRTVLVPVPDASGTRFAAPDDPGTSVTTRGATVFVSLGGEALPACAVVPPASPRPYRAQGSDPAWTLDLVAGRLSLVTEDGARRIEAALPEARFEDGAFVHALAEPPLTLRIAPGLCRDDRTGMPYPERVTITLDGRDLRGCGGDPRDLLTGAEWVVEDVEGRGIIDAARITLAFAADGGLSGTASCNRYATRIDLGGEGLALAQIAATRMLCPEVLMQQEAAFFAALARVVRFDFDATGALLLYDAAAPAPVLTARR